MSESSEITSSSTSANPIAIDLSGRTIDGKYLVIEQLGRGGSGVVYKAEHTLINRLVALKVLHAHLVQNEDSLKRFHHEARVASKLNHPNAVLLYDFGLFENMPYLVMEYLEGTTLKEKIKEHGALSVSEVNSVFQQVGSALAEAHRIGIVHRDLKPENIMITHKEDGTDFVKVLDFGIAKLLHQSGEKGATVVTQAGLFYGTPQYASPEQVVSRELDARSDIYSLGIILYEALSGEVPFTAPSLMEILMKQLHEQPVGLRTKKPLLKTPKEIDDILLKCLQKEPGNRYQSVDQLLRDLSHSSVNSKPETVTSSTPTRPWLILSVSTALIAVLVFSAYWGLQQMFPSWGAKSATEEIAEEEASEEATPPASLLLTKKEETINIQPSTNNTKQPDTNQKKEVSIVSFLLQSAVKPEQVVPDEQNLIPSQEQDNLLHDLPSHTVEANTVDVHALDALQKAPEEIPSLTQETDSSSIELPGNVQPPSNAALGSVFVISTPSAAEVYLDGKLQGITPLRLTELENKELPLTVKLVGHEDYQQVISPQAGEEQNLSITLKKSADAKAKRQEAEGFFREGERLYEAKQYDQAVAELNQAIEYHPGHIRARLVLGITYLRLGKHDKAREQFQTAIKADANYAPAHYNLACYYALMNQHDLALQSLEKSITLNPRSRNWARSEPDLASLRKLDGFKRLMR